MFYIVYCGTVAVSKTLIILRIFDRYFEPFAIWASARTCPSVRLIREPQILHNVQIGK